MKIVTAGEFLWDVFEAGEYLGGAPFNFAAHAHRLGHDVRLVSAVGDDERGDRALEAMRRIGLPADFVPRVAHPTGVVSVSLNASGEPDFEIHRPGAYDFLQFDPRLIEFQTDWLYFGTMVQTPAIAEMIEKIPARRFYDVNLRRNCYTRELVERLKCKADAIKLNEHELATLGWQIEDLPAKYKCVTRGARGCVVMIGDDYAECAGYPVRVADTVGAGDAFAAAFLHGIGEGWAAAKIGDFANRLGALVASRPGAVPVWTVQEIR